MRAEISNPPGSTAPGSATTTRSSTAKLRAPQMMPLTWSAPDLHLAPADRLLEPGQLLDLADAPDDERAGDLRRPVHVLDLEADAHERLGDVVDTGQLAEQLGQPGLRNPHGNS